jgi:hypothetical protein
MLEKLRKITRFSQETSIKENPSFASEIIEAVLDLIQGCE